MDMISYYFCRFREYKINVTYNDFISLKKYSVKVIVPAVLLGSVICK